LKSVSRRRSVACPLRVARWSFIEAYTKDRSDACASR
jgi:hypothetical protein